VFYSKRNSRRSIHKGTTVVLFKKGIAGMRKGTIVVKKNGQKGTTVVPFRKGTTSAQKGNNSCSIQKGTLVS
jgi:hypothetical protein